MSMGRTAKKGLEYFPFDIYFFHDISIRKLIRCQGGQSVTVYALLLCYIYKDGYYINWDDELPFIISEQTGFGEEYIQDVIQTCLNIGLLDKGLYDNERILSSKGIQERYTKICAISRRSHVIAEYNLLSDELETVSSIKHVSVATNIEPYTLSLSDEIETLKSEKVWLDQLQGLYSMNIENLRNSLDDFRVQCIADGKDRHTSLKDAKQHFNSWLRIINNKKINNESRYQSKRTESFRQDKTPTYDNGFE